MYYNTMEIQFLNKVKKNLYIMLKGLKKYPITAIYLVVLLIFPFFKYPYIFSGDEPHYLLAIQSLIQDHDLNLDNNYLNVNQGKKDAGMLVSLRKYLPDHHTVFVKPGASAIQWNQTKTPNILIKSGYYERPIHPAIFICIYTLLSVLFFPFVSLEVSVLLVTHLLQFATLWLFYLFSKQFLKNNLACIATIIFAFGTSFWFFSNTIYPEILLSFLTLASVYLFMNRKWMFLCGLCITVAGMMKLPYLSIVLVFGLVNIITKQYRQLRDLILSVSIGLLCYLMFNRLVYFDPLFLPITGNPFHPVQPSYNFTPWTGFIGLLIGSQTGIFLFSPFLFFSFIQIILFLQKRIFNLLSLIPLIIFCSFSFWGYWNGGYSFSYRLILPAIPFFVLLAFLYYRNEKRKDFRLLFYVLVFFSVVNQFLSVMIHPSVVTASAPILYSIIINK